MLDPAVLETHLAGLLGEEDPAGQGIVARVVGGEFPVLDLVATHALVAVGGKVDEGDFMVLLGAEAGVATEKASMGRDGPGRSIGKGRFPAAAGFAHDVREGLPEGNLVVIAIDGRSVISFFARLVLVDVAPVLESPVNGRAGLFVGLAPKEGRRDVVFLDHDVAIDDELVIGGGRGRFDAENLFLHREVAFIFVGIVEKDEFLGPGDVIGPVLDVDPVLEARNEGSFELEGQNDVPGKGRGEVFSEEDQALAFQTGKGDFVEVVG